MSHNELTATDAPAHRRRRLVGYSLSLGVVIAGAWVALGSPRPASYAGPLLVLDHLYSVALALTLLAICSGVGRRILTLARFDLSHPIEEIVFSSALGATAVSLSILFCGLIGILWTPVILALLLLWAVIAHREIAGLPDLVARGVSRLSGESGHRAMAWAGIAVLVLVAAYLILQAVAPPSDWDSLMYHLQVPRHFLQEGRIYVPDDNLHVAFIGLVHMLYLPLLALGSATAPAVLSVLFALLLGLAGFSLAARFFNSNTPTVALITLWSTTGIILVAITPRVDVTLALYLFLAQYALLIALSRRDHRRFMYLAAFLLGSAVGVKYNALAYALALAPLALWIAFASAGGVRAAAKTLVVFGLIAAAAALPWLAKNWLLLHAPFYPFFSARILPPWLANLYGSSAIPAGVDTDALRALASARLPFNLFDLFFAPGRLTVEQEGVHYHMNLLYLLLPLSLFFFRNKTLLWLVIPAVAYLVIILVPFPATNLRYLIPAFPALTVSAAFVADRLAGRFLSASGARLLLICLAMLSLFPSAKAMRFWLLRSDVLGNLVGTTSRQEYLETGFYLYSQLLQASNTLVPRDGDILLLFEARGYYFEPQIIQDNAITNWMLLVPKLETDSTCLAETEITHVLLNDLAVRYYASRGTDVMSLGISNFPAFARRCLTLVERGQGFMLFELNRDDEADSGSQ